jgi:hypothetical protein
MNDTTRADLITAKLTIELVLSGADYADLHAAAEQVKRAADALTAARGELTEDMHQRYFGMPEPSEEDDRYLEHVHANADYDAAEQEAMYQEQRSSR